MVHLSGDPEFWGVCDLSESALGGSERMRLLACMLTFSEGFLASGVVKGNQSNILLWLWHRYEFVYPNF